MRKAIISLIAVFAFWTAADASGPKKLTFVPQWIPQAQHAGYYIAKDKGFFADEGLDVTIRHLGINSTESISDILLNGEAQIVGMQFLQALVQRSDGKPVINVLQVTQQSGACCVANRPISRIEDLDGMRIGKWKQGFSEFCEIMEIKKNLHIEWIPFVNNGINLLIFKAIDAMLCYSYSELISYKLAVGEVKDENVLRLSEVGYNCPEDGLYTTESFYRKNKDAVEAFNRAVKRGWEYADSHRDEALQITKKYMKEGKVSSNDIMQREMLDEYLRLQVNPITGENDWSKIDEYVFNYTVGMLLELGYITGKVEYSEFVK